MNVNFNHKTLEKIYKFFDKEANLILSQIYLNLNSENVPLNYTVLGCVFHFFYLKIQNQ